MIKSLIWLFFSVIFSKLIVLILITVLGIFLFKIFPLQDEDDLIIRKKILKIMEKIFIFIYFLICIIFCCIFMLSAKYWEIISIMFFMFKVRELKGVKSIIHKYSEEIK